MWIKSAAGAACHTAGINWSRLLTTEQLYFLLFVILPFTGFGLAVAASYVRYRRWLGTQPRRA